MRLSFAAALGLATSSLAAPPNSETTPGEPMPAAEAAASMSLPDGFTASVFAAEPDIYNPIACSWDSRGRLWVAENLTYERLGSHLDPSQQDRILIFEDTDHDGVHDQRTIFADGLSQLTGIEWTPAGLWIMCPPQLLFLPDKDRDDQADGPAQVILDGFHVAKHSHHTFANGLRIGPDGWLYGRCGPSSPGELGKPGTPQADRIPTHGGIWRYHRTLGIVEALNHGTTNPWGHDWNRDGELFFINTVNGHFYHSITGAHYKRGVSKDPNPLAYDLIEMHADHWHFDTGSHWTKSRDGAANDFGGGHAHVGFMIYQADQWPAEYRDHAFTLNLHGRRCNQETLERNESGYVARHAPDFFVSKDPFFRGIELTTGPDGGVYVLDWSDTGECHENTGVHRNSGRIYKITHGKPALPAHPDLAKLTDTKLLDLHDHPNAWFPRMARQELNARKDRRLPPASSSLSITQLQTLATCDPDFSADFHLTSQDESVRAWAIDRLVDSWPLDTVTGHRPPRTIAPDELHLSPLHIYAKTDPSPLVRLKIASALQRLPLASRIELAGILAAHAEDATDHNLPLMIWYGLIPIARDQPANLIPIAKQSRIPLIQQFIARRLIEDIDPPTLDALLELAATQPLNLRRATLVGLITGSAGRQQLPKPTTWDHFAASLANDPPSAGPIRNLNILFGDGRTLDEVRKIASDANAPITARQTALQTLIQARPDDLAKTCKALLTVRHLNRWAAQGLILANSPQAGKLITAHYQKIHPSDRPAVIELLVSRPASANSLLDAIAAQKIPRNDLSPYHARLIQNLGDQALGTRLTEVWGTRSLGRKEQLAFIESLRNRHQQDAFSGADLAAGRRLFNQSCSACHQLYGQGAAIGPDLTGSGRSNIDYLLENIVTPAATLDRDYYLHSITTRDGRVIAGILASETEHSLKLRTMSGVEIIEREQIRDHRTHPLSLMPEGLLEALTPDQQRDLLAYLMSPVQTPIDQSR